MKKLNVSIIIISIILLLSLNTVYATSVGTTSTTNETVETNELSEEAIEEARANKNLSSLEVVGYELSPYFNKNNLT